MKGEYDCNHCGAAMTICKVRRVAIIIENQLEELEAARTAYLWLPILTSGYLSLPLVISPYLPLPPLSLLFPTFPYLSLPFLSLTGPYLSLTRP